MENLENQTLTSLLKKDAPNINFDYHDLFNLQNRKLPLVYNSQNVRNFNEIKLIS